MQLPAIPKFDQAAADKAVARQNQLTKPQGSLGRLENLSVLLAGMTGRERPRFARKAVIVMAADHGVALEGVSAYPVEVTAQMVENIARNGAAVSVLARQNQARVVIVDIGVARDISSLAGVLHRKVATGSANMLKGPAMTPAQAEKAIAVGMQVLDEQAAQGLDLVALGEMGIGNTTPASAITAVLTGLPVKEVTGRGTGLDDAGLQKKIGVIKAAIRLNRPDPADALDVLAKVGGLDIAGLTGVIIAAAARRIPVVVDGFISGAAALVAAGLLPEVKPYLIASHLSVEAGHTAICRKLELEPLLDLRMRLGEGSGAVLVFPIIEGAARILDEMATFEEAGVSTND
jgi:nicotinate-nucleotide--dimethylbenzimidazole phosphoribosyltransferase